VEFKADWQEHLNAYLNYSYQHSRDNQTHIALPGVPAHRVRAGANIGLLNNFLNINTGIRWNGKRSRAAGDTRADMPTTTVVDLAVSTDKVMDGLSLTLKAHNLLDTNIFDPAPISVQAGYPRPGRTWLAEAEYTFL